MSHIERLEEINLLGRNLKRLEGMVASLLADMKAESEAVEKAKRELEEIHQKPAPFEAPIEVGSIWVMSCSKSSLGPLRARVVEVHSGIVFCECSDRYGKCVWEFDRKRFLRLFQIDNDSHKKQSNLRDLNGEVVKDNMFGVK